MQCHLSAGQFVRWCTGPRRAAPRGIGNSPCRLVRHVCVGMCGLWCRFHHMPCNQGSNDFVKLLNSVRDGSCGPAMLAFLQARCTRELDVSDGVLPVKVPTTGPCCVVFCVYATVVLLCGGCAVSGIQ